jgi:sulfur relay (sulfurtransferase) complex TusBCD TusD component (DsrE family)
MRGFIMFGAIALMFFFSAAAGAAEVQKKEGGIFVNITSSDAIRAPMAVRFAEKGIERGIPMTIFLNVEGVRLAVKKFHSPQCKKAGSCVQEMLTKFMKNGGRVIICPMCLESNGYDKSDLIDGVEMGDAKITFTSILASDKVISY